MHRRSSLLIAGLTLLSAGVTACAGDDGPRELDATITSASLSVNDAEPDAPVGFDANVSLEASGSFDAIRLLEIRAITLPEGSDSLSVELDGTLQGPQDNAEVISASSGSTVVGRIVGGGTTNAELAGWCRRIVLLSVQFEADELTTAAEMELAVTCP